MKSLVTCLYESENSLIVGTETGDIEEYSFDQNYSIYQSELSSLKTHSTEIIQFWPHSQNSIKAVDSDGCIHDIRNSDSNEIQIGTPISCFNHHPHMPLLFAYGHVPDQSIRICEMSTDHFLQLQSIKYHDGFLGQRLGYINGIIWHPGRMVLGTISNEVFVSIYGL